MQFKEARKIAQHLKKYEAEIDSMVNSMGVMAKNHFTANFRKQGFEDETVIPWQKRKKEDVGRGILIGKGSGRLKRSIAFRKKGKWAVVINTGNIPYAKIHNEGGIINKGASTKVLNFNKKGGFQRQRTERQRAKTSYSQKVSIGSHTILMPKRQFIGYSGKLNRQIISSFSSKIKRIFA